MSEDQSPEVPAAVRAASRDRIAARTGKSRKVAEVIEEKKAAQAFSLPEKPETSIPFPFTKEAVLVNLCPAETTPADRLPAAKEVRPPHALSPGFLTILIDGSMTKAENWQKEAIDGLAETGAQLANPRTWEDSQLSTTVEIDAQIKWEQKALVQAAAAVFWFSAGRTSVHAWFRLGQLIARKTPVFVGCHPSYERAGELKDLLTVATPGLKVHESLRLLLVECAGFVKTHHKR